MLGCLLLNCSFGVCLFSWWLLPCWILVLIVLVWSFFYWLCLLFVVIMIGLFKLQTGWGALLFLLGATPFCSVCWVVGVVVIRFSLVVCGVGLCVHWFGVWCCVACFVLG